MPPFLPFMPNVDQHLEAFQQALYLKPAGHIALGKALFIKPQLPEEGAGADPTVLGREAIQAVAGMRNATDEMALAAQQAQAIARNTRVASVRAYEALRSYKEIHFREAHAAWEAKQGGLGIPGMTQFYSPPQPFFATSFAGKKGGKSKGGGAAGAMGALGGLGGGGDEGPEANLMEMDLQHELETTFAFVRKASLDAAQTAHKITKQYEAVRGASRALTEALKLPGDPLPPPIPPVMLKPPKRPRDLSPFWLDVPYAMDPGADPYAHHDGAPRDSAAETIMGYPGFNPFEGTVPFSEAGLHNMYKDVAYKSQGGKVEPGIDLGEGGAGGLMGMVKGLM